MIHLFKINSLANIKTYNTACVGETFVEGVDTKMKRQGRLIYEEFIEKPRINGMSVRTRKKIMAKMEEVESLAREKNMLENL